MEKTMQKSEADRLFLEHAVLIGECDVVPLPDAVDIFGADVIDHVRGVLATSIRHYDTPGTSGIDYITYTGFLRAVTRRNILVYIDTRCSREAGGAAVVDIADYNGRRAAAR